MKILITGATGFVGRSLTKKLLGLGHEVILLTRDKEKAKYLFERVEKNKKLFIYEWKTIYESHPPNQIVENLKGVYNLMGEDISTGRWSVSKKKKIIQSRIDCSRDLICFLEKNLKFSLDFYFQASAIGIYKESDPMDGPDGRNCFLNETSPYGDDFLSQVCQKWEMTIADLTLVKRKVIGRLGIVIDPQDGGIVKKLKPIFKWGMGADLGTGEQWMSWIALEDLTHILIDIIGNEKMEGVFNLVSPSPIRNSEFTQLLALVLGKNKFPFAIPCFILKIALGEKSKIVLSSHRVFPENYLKKGGTFNFEKIVNALKN